MSGRIVYAVEHGEYSDRTTDCIFETKALADGYIQAIRSAIDGPQQAWAYPDPDMMEIVEYQLWDSVPVVRVERGWLQEPVIGEGEE